MTTDTNLGPSMRWEVAIPADGGTGEPRKVSVEGDTWLAALTTGLARSGIKTPAGEAGFAVLIHDEGVEVSDFALNRRISLRYLDPRPKSAPAASPSVASVPPRAPDPAVATLQDGSSVTAVPKVPAVPYQVIFRRDEDRDARNAVTYRERVLAVRPRTTRDDVERVLRAVFDQIVAEIASKPAGKFVHLTVFDHVFQGPPTRPALGALSWKDWRGAGPDVTFPAFAAGAPGSPAVAPAGMPDPVRLPDPAPLAIPETPVRSVPRAAPQVKLEPAQTTASPLPGPKTLVDRPTPLPTPPPSTPPPAAAIPKTAPMAVVPTPARGVPIADRTTPVPAERGDRISWIPAATQTGRTRKPSAEILLATSENAEDLLAEVFEAMQDLYVTRTREEAARFGLTLSLQKVPSESSAILLHDLATGTLVYVAALGPGTEPLVGQRTSRDEGLIGAAIQEGGPIVVQSGDARLDADFDRLTGSRTATALCAPIVHEGRVLGALLLVNRRGGKPFTDEEANLVGYILEKLAEHLVQSLPEVQLVD